MSKIVNISKDFLEEQYIELEKSVTMIHKEFNYSKKVLYDRLRKMKIIRTQKEACRIYKHEPNCLCCICKAKRGESFGENNSMFGIKSPNFIDGRSLGIYYCIEPDCDKIINYQTWYFGSKKCRSCSLKNKKKI